MRCLQHLLKWSNDKNGFFNPHRGKTTHTTQHNTTTMENTAEIRKYLEKTIKDATELLATMDGIAPAKKTRAPKKAAVSDEKTEEVKEETKETPKKETKKSPAKKSNEKDTSDSDTKAQRIARMTPALKKKLDEMFATMNIEKNDKFNAEYRDYINKMSATDYDKHEDKALHMEEFVRSKGSNAAGGGPSTPTYKNVSELKGLTEVGTGVFQDKNNTIVTGPAEDGDEDMEEAKFKGDDYVVGSKTKRVYKVDPAGGPDEFVGFWGIGKFAGADD